VAQLALEVICMSFCRKGVLTIIPGLGRAYGPLTRCLGVPDGVFGPRDAAERARALSPTLGLRHDAKARLSPGPNTSDRCPP
jgi:hypothetical protein